MSPKFQKFLPFICALVSFPIASYLGIVMMYVIADPMRQHGGSIALYYLVSFGTPVIVFIYVRRNQEGQYEQRTQSAHQGQLALNQPGHETPRYAFSEPLTFPSHALLNHESVERLVRSINEQLWQAPVEGCELVVAKGQPNETLCLRCEGLWIWAEIFGEVTRVRIEVRFAEKSNRKWRSKHETNWNFEQSRGEARQRLNSNELEVNLLNGAIYGMFGAKLSVRAAQKAQIMRQAFMLSIASGVEAWSSKTTTNLESPIAPPPVQRRARD